MGSGRWSKFLSSCIFFITLTVLFCFLVKMTEKAVVLSKHIETHWFKLVKLVNPVLFPFSTPKCGPIVFGVSRENVYNLKEHVLMRDWFDCSNLLWVYLYGVVCPVDVQSFYTLIPEFYTCPDYPVTFQSCFFFLFVPYTVRG